MPFYARNRILVAVFDLIRGKAGLFSKLYNINGFISNTAGLSGNHL